MPLRLWVQDHFTAGICVVISETEEEARKLMESGFCNYTPIKALESYTIQEGVMVYNLGDS